MRSRALALTAAAVALSLGACSVEAAAAERAATPPAVSTAEGIDHAGWDRLLAAYVDARGLVAYARWKASEIDREALRRYLASLAVPAPAAPERLPREAELAAALVNAYNACTIDWILQNYPTASIRSLPASFTAARHVIGGKRVSLDQIEQALRKRVGFRVHAAISCASRSCPPLARRAFTGGRLNGDLDERMRAWLAREDLNQFDPARRRARISQVFRWFAGDFEKAGGLRSVLARYAPARDREFLTRGDLTIEYLPYDWGLNDQGKEGRGYGRLHLLWDKIRDRLGL